VKLFASSAKFTLPSRFTVGFTIALVAIVFAGRGGAQSVPYQRAFPQSKAIVEKRVKELQSSTAGHLPSLEGFSLAGDLPLDRFRRGYYQCTAQVNSTPSGGSMVRVNVTITAWYTGPVPGKSGYQVLPSNGRLEADFLDRLQESLGGQESSSEVKPAGKPLTSQNSPSAPPFPASSVSPRDAARGAKSKPPTGSPFNLGDPLSLDHMSSLATQKAVIDRRVEEQEKEVKGLEEILRNQTHPSNLVAVKKKDTPVLANPIESAKVLFLAAAEDEFELLDANPNWVHVRISGISRGWIRRSSLEMPTSDPNPQPSEAEAQSQPAHSNDGPFHVQDEQIASFPGTWAPLLGKTVRIVTVQKATDNLAVTGPEAKLAFARSLFEKEYGDLIGTPSSIAGIVIIFDSDDGGMVAATTPALQQWKEETLSDESFWRRCLFDPQEAFWSGQRP
jgi:hypothetical protein